MGLVKLSDFEKVFLGGCNGIGLTKRGPDDPHVCFTILTEDDENWFVDSGGASSFWLKDLQTVLAEAMDWIEKNCDPDIPTNDSWPKGQQCGWKFRDSP